MGERIKRGMDADESPQEIDVNFHFSPHAIPRIFGNLKAKPVEVEIKKSGNDRIWNWSIWVMGIGMVLGCVVLPVVLLLIGFGTMAAEVKTELQWMFRAVQGWL